MEYKNYTLNLNSNVPFRNNTDYCIGTARMSLALRTEYQEQLKLVQDEIGFSYIRGHGLFCDDMGIYHEYTDNNGKVCVEYNFTYLDMVMDFYKEVHIKPFLELGLMPKELASGTQCIFYWEGKTTPPKDYDRWCDLIKATLNHLIKRYGRDEVITWPVEVWNEPNQTMFWENKDKDEYNKLFKLSFQAVKDVDPRFLVGGPSICEGDDEEWISYFLDFCKKEQLAIDFVSRHQYMIELTENDGHYEYSTVHPVDESMITLQTTKKQLSTYSEFCNLPIYVTEYSTAYTSRCPMHDTNMNAAYIAAALPYMEEINEANSYWTFGDMFEEWGVPWLPFYGGFGLVANGLIKKPTFWTYAFYKKLKGVCIHRTDDGVIVKKPDGSICGLLWNLDRNFSGRELSIDFTLPVEEESTYCLITKLVDEETCNPFKMWNDLGAPRTLTTEQKLLLRSAANPLVSSASLKSDNGELHFNFILKSNAIEYFELSKVTYEGDRGFSYERTVQSF